jgi:predicted DNA-binding protein (UPF0251 family)
MDNMVLSVPLDNELPLKDISLMYSEQAAKEMEVQKENNRKLLQARKECEILVEDKKNCCCKQGKKART